MRSGGMRAGEAGDYRATPIPAPVSAMRSQAASGDAAGSATASGMTAVASISRRAASSISAFDLDRSHRREVPADQLAIGGAQRATAREVFTLVDDVPGHSHEVLGAAAGFGEHRHDVRQRLPRLADEIRRLELLGRIPADLAADEHEPPARRRAVGVTLGRGPSGGLQHFDGFARIRAPDSLMSSPQAGSAVPRKRSIRARRSSPIGSGLPVARSMCTTTVRASSRG